MYGEYGKPSGRNADQTGLSSVIKKIQEDDLPQNIPDKKAVGMILGTMKSDKTVPYKYESNIPNMNGYKTSYCTWHDKMDKALTIPVEKWEDHHFLMKRGKATPRKKGIAVNTNPGGEDTFRLSFRYEGIRDKQFLNFNEQENTMDRKMT